MQDCNLKFYRTKSASHLAAAGLQGPTALDTASNWPFILKISQIISLLIVYKTYLLLEYILFYCFLN